MAGTVYLLHFDKPYKHARHYIGYAGVLSERIARHRKGTGARLLEVVGLAGIGFKVARTWHGTRTLERQLKNQHKHKALCPICTPGAGAGRGWKRNMKVRMSVSIPAELAQYARNRAKQEKTSTSKIVAIALTRMRNEERNKEIMQGLTEDAEFNQAMANNDWAKVAELEAQT
jgi:predicted GIY-YIG superfamily endonuclease